MRPYFPTCFCSRMKQNHFRIFKKTKRNSTVQKSLVLLLDILMISSHRITLITVNTSQTPSELELKDTTDTKRTASYRYLFLNTDTDGCTKLYDIRDELLIVYYSFCSSSISYLLSYGVYMLYFCNFPELLMRLNCSNLTMKF